MSGVIDQYGFTWGKMRVTRLTRIEGQGWVVGVKADGKSDCDGLQIYLSEGGRSLRVWHKGKELK